MVDVNPIWWGQQAQREPKVELSRLIILKNCHCSRYFKNVTFCVHKVHAFQVLGCGDGVGKLAYGNGQDK